jgi:hypothetical protein
LMGNFALFILHLCEWQHKVPIIDMVHFSGFCFCLLLLLVLTSLLQFF